MPATTVSALKVNDASEITFIDNDGDEKIDLAVVTPVEFGEVTYLSSKNITVNGGVLNNAKLDDCEVADGVAKDDQVAVIKAAYVGNDKNVITKLESVTGKVTATKTGEARIDSTWYDVAGTLADVKNDAKGDFFIYNGYIVAVDVTGGSISDVAYLISSGETMDIDGNYQAKVMVGGETKIVAMDETNDVEKGAKDLFVTYEVKDGAYKFTKIAAGELTDTKIADYTAVEVKRYEDKRVYTETNNGTDYLLDDNAVVYVKYNTDKYAILTGKDVAGWGDKAKEFNSSTAANASKSMILHEDKDGMKKVKCAFLDLGTNKIPAAVASYGIIVSDVVTNNDDDLEFTLWTGTEQIEVVTSDTGFFKWQAVEYAKNSDDTYKIDSVKVKSDADDLTSMTTGKGGLYSIMDNTNGVVRLANASNEAKNYNITDDTQIIYVDVSADDVADICVAGGSIQNAGTPDNGTNYYRNASFSIDSGDDLALLIVATNAEGVTKGKIAK